MELDSTSCLKPNNGKGTTHLREVRKGDYGRVGVAGSGVRFQGRLNVACNCQSDQSYHASAMQGMCMWNVNMQGKALRTLKLVRASTAAGVATGSCELVSCPSCPSELRLSPTSLH